jgi:hypothetical protein
MYQISTNVLSVWIAWFILWRNSHYQWIFVNPILTSFLKHLEKKKRKEYDIYIINTEYQGWALYQELFMYYVL